MLCKQCGMLDHFVHGPSDSGSREVGSQSPPAPCLDVLARQQQSSRPACLNTLESSTYGAITGIVRNEGRLAGYKLENDLILKSSHHPSTFERANACLPRERCCQNACCEVNPQLAVSNSEADELFDRKEEWHASGRQFEEPVLAQRGLPPKDSMPQVPLVSNVAPSPACSFPRVNGTCTYSQPARCCYLSNNAFQEGTLLLPGVRELSYSREVGLGNSLRGLSLPNSL